MWDFMTGKLKFSLANSGLGTIITHALVNEEGTHTVSKSSHFSIVCSGGCRVWRNPVLGHGD